MRETGASCGWQDRVETSGCAYIFGDPREHRGGWRACGHPRQPGSSYCPHHHRRCHLKPGSAAEARRLVEVEALAAAVGGRRAQGAGLPPERFLDRLEELVCNLS